MKVYHGTTDALVDKISKHGLWDWENKQPAWLTASLNEAVFFASLRSLSGGDPAVIEVDVPGEHIVSVGSLGLYTKKVIASDRILSVYHPPIHVWSSIKRQALFYPGWMGVMETAQFIQRADEQDLRKFKDLVDKGKFDEAWKMVELLLNLPHHELSETKASLTLYAAVSRFADPVANGLSASETLTDSIGVAANHRGYQVVIVKVAPNAVEDVPSDGDVDVSFFVPKAAISPLFVRAVYNPWARRSFKMSAFDVAFNLDDLLSVVSDKKELAAFRGLVNDCGEVHPRNIPAFVQRAAPYLLSLMKKSNLAYPPDHLFGLLRKGTMLQDGYGNYSLNRFSTEDEKTLLITVGDIVKDINTSTEGEVIAISKMHHEADIDIVVRWDRPINGQEIFEVHPNEIEFVRHKTEEEILKDVDRRYYDESILEGKGLKTRLDYGVRTAANQFFSTDQFQILWDSYDANLDYYKALGHIDMVDSIRYWAVESGTPPSENLKFIDPEEITLGLIDFRSSLKQEYENADEMIADASKIILEVANARLNRVKAGPAAEPSTRRTETAPEEKKTEEKGRGGTSESAPDLPPGTPTWRKPDLNGLILDDDGSRCVSFIRAYAVFVEAENKWKVYVAYREPTLKDLGDDVLEIEDYLNRRSLCISEQPSQ